MPALRYCRSCAGPRPRAARFCPWCHRASPDDATRPEHLFAVHERIAPPHTSVGESRPVSS